MRALSDIVTFALLLVLASAVHIRPSAKSLGKDVPTNWMARFQALDAWKDEEIAGGFRGKPSEADWPERWAKSLREGLEDPCNATVQAIMGTGGAGFGSRITSLFNELWLAVYAGLPVSLRFTGDPFEDMWAKHFSNIAGIATCSERASYVGQGHGGHPPWRVAAELADRLSASDPSYVDGLKRFVAPFAYTYGSEVSGIINATLEQLGLGDGMPYVGVHIRHGDKVTETALVPTEAYADAVRGINATASLYTTHFVDVIHRALQQAGARHVFLASDDPDALEDLQTVLGEAAEVKAQERLPQQAYTDRIYRDDGAVASVLADVEALRRSSFFVGTESSNVGRLVWLLRGKDMPSLSLDGAFPTP